MIRWTTFGTLPIKISYFSVQSLQKRKTAVHFIDYHGFIFLTSFFFDEKTIDLRQTKKIHG